MFPDEKKLTRLTNVAKMYYEQELSQNEIAKKIGVSRPMVSKLLSEAKSLGIVIIKINQVHSFSQILQDRFAKEFNLKKVVIVNVDGIANGEVDNKIASSAYENCLAKKDAKVGIGCGSTLGFLSEYSESKREDYNEYHGEIFPLIGGLKASYRSYHTNELVRSIGETTGLHANYFYLPALVDTSEEKEIFKKTELYLSIEKHWKSMNTSFINVSNLYSTPDLATSIRFGKRLTQQKAVGRFLAYYYDVQGNLIDAEQDNVMQIEIEQLEKSRDVIALCAEKVETQSVVGALRTGVFTGVVISDVLASKVLNYVEN